jgi:hypothetical protein
MKVLLNKIKSIIMQLEIAFDCDQECKMQVNDGLDQGAMCDS